MKTTGQQQLDEGEDDEIHGDKRQSDFAIQLGTANPEIRMPAGDTENTRKREGHSQESGT
jgi:hypothetical protein